MCSCCGLPPRTSARDGGAREQAPFANELDPTCKASLAEYSRLGMTGLYNLGRGGLIALHAALNWPLRVPMLTLVRQLALGEEAVRAGGGPACELPLDATDLHAFGLPANAPTFDIPVDDAGTNTPKPISVVTREIAIP